MVYLEVLYNNYDLVLYNHKTKEKTKLVSRERKPVYPCWVKDDLFLIYAPLQDYELNKYDFSTKDDTVFPSSKNLKLYPSIGGDNKRILFSKETIEGKGGSIACVFILKWLDMETSKTYIVHLVDKLNYLSIIRALWISE